MILKIILCYMFVGVVTTAIHHKFIFYVIDFALATTKGFDKIWNDLGNVGEYFVYKLIIIMWSWFSICAVRYYLNQMKY